jgi:hypothetical protein
MRRTPSFCEAFVVCFLGEFEPWSVLPVKKLACLSPCEHSTVPEVVLNGQVEAITAKPLVEAPSVNGEERKTEAIPMEPLNGEEREALSVHGEGWETVSGERAAKSPGVKVAENAPQKISSTRMVKGSPREADRQNAMETYPEDPHHSSKTTHNPPVKPCRTLGARSAKISPP